MNNTKPEFIDKKKYKSFLSSTKNVNIVDALSPQIRELFIIKNPKLKPQDKKITFSSQEYKKFEKQKKDESVLVYFPWSNTLIKIVDEKDYFKLLTNRNQDLINSKEQEKLYQYKIAIFGMSVGSNISFVLAQSGISREIVLADYDELDTTNLNRIAAGVHQVGLNKAVVAARKIYEINPFAKVTLLEEGITEENFNKLINKNKIDCIVEEIDSVEMKLHIRRKAAAHKLPVLMITDNGDGVVLHIERYDLGYNKVFNQEWEYWDELEKILKKSKEKLGEIIVNEIIGGIDNVDNRVKMSVDKVMKGELVSWPQLGSAALLGGVISTIAIKKMVLGIDKEIYTWKNIQLLQ